MLQKLYEKLKFTELENPIRAWDYGVEIPVGSVVKFEDGEIALIGDLLSDAVEGGCESEATCDIIVAIAHINQLVED